MKLGKKKTSALIAVFVLMGTLATARAWLPNVGFWSPSGCTHGKQTFVCTGGLQTFTVSAANCTALTIKAWGAGGVGSGYIDECDGNYYFDGGGGGGFATLTYTATVGHNLTVYAGCSTGPYAGYPDGGAQARGYANGTPGAGGGYWEGNGGGSSSVYDSSTELLEAGGGGGGFGGWGGTNGGPGGGTNSSCGSPGRNSGVNAVYWTSAGGGGGYCGGTAGQGGSSYFTAGGSQTPGIGVNAGNTSDPDYWTFGGNNGDTGYVVIKY